MAKKKKEKKTLPAKALGSLALDTRPPKVDGSLLSRLIVDTGGGDLRHHTAIMLYGKSKLGKTRLAAREGAVLARALGSPLVYVFTEANVDDFDIATVVGACARFGVTCAVGVITDTSSREAVGAAFRKLAGIEARVYVVDSVTGVADVVIETADPSELKRMGGMSSSYGQFQQLVIGPLRRKVSSVARAGWLLLVAQARERLGSSSTQLEPRYVTKVDYVADTWIEVVVPQNTKKECQRARAHTRVRKARRDPDVVGATMCYVLEEQTVTAKGSLMVYEARGWALFTWFPEGAGPLKTGSDEFIEPGTPQEHELPFIEVDPILFWMSSVGEVREA